jgi:NAD(P)-dependent dehydrogenase (short-subunit alcohol dehydrogenase family)
MIMPLLDGRAALVTGGAMGIGAAIVERFADEGATVAVIDIEPAPPDSRAGAWVIQDLGCHADLAGAVGEAERGLGRDIEILVNCAAVPAVSGALECSADEWRRVLGIALDAPVFLMQIVGRRMAERRAGRIVNITSVHASHGAVGTLAYDVAKAGLENATRSFGIELAPHGVAVNAVAPGFVDTRLADLTADWFRTDYVATGRLPAGRGAQPTEIAAHVTWLASDQAGYANATVLTIDGGLTATF